MFLNTFQLTQMSSNTYNLFEYHWSVSLSEPLKINSLLSICSLLPEHRQLNKTRTSHSAATTPCAVLSDIRAFNIWQSAWHVKQILGKFNDTHKVYCNYSDLITLIIRHYPVILRMLELFISPLDDFLRHLPLAYTQTYLEPLRFSSCRCWLFDLSILEWSRIPGWQKLRTVWNSWVLVVTLLNTSKRGCCLTSVPERHTICCEKTWDQKLSPGAWFYHDSGWIQIILSTPFSLK